MYGPSMGNQELAAALKEYAEYIGHFLLEFFY